MFLWPAVTAANKQSITEFHRRLLRWYRRNKREMPWRGTKDPYRIWLSEIMLQQTRVATVVDYYRRFLKRFPSIRALAKARGEDVLRQWAGLGYYSRARNLQSAARKVVKTHGGKFPTQYEEIRELPGIGDYTAAAISSIAFDEPRAVLHGNVARVVARLQMIRGDLRLPSRWKELHQRAQNLLQARSPGDWNQAMMELGAVICTPRAPDCGHCPLSSFCAAYKQGLAEELPEKRNKRPTEDVHLTVLVCVDANGDTLLQRGGDALFSGMWQFPAKRNERGALKAASRLVAGLGLQTSDDSQFESLPAVRHTVTFRKLTLRPYLFVCKSLKAPAGTKRVPLAKVDSVPTSSATRKIARVAREHLARERRAGSKGAMLQSA